MTGDDEASMPPQDYGIERWGDGYFSINAEGHVAVTMPLRDDESRYHIDFVELTACLRGAGLRLPVLVRFDDILSHRVNGLYDAFAQAARHHAFEGGYRVVYPIKVNQQRTVVERIVSVGTDRVGLEAGSKPELLAVLASAQRGSLIVCNGYKDREYVRMALIGQRLGYRPYIVIEKTSELDLVAREADDLDIEPLLGIRVRLATVASGNWQNSGGSRSKFGLSAAQALGVVDRLRALSGLKWLRLLHAHIGSQIPDLQDIERGVEELARFYAAFRDAGAPIDIVDVGGGLGVDYDGSRSPQSYCSANYDFAAYAEAVTSPIARVCSEQKLPHPLLVSESGRAITAHHAVLITEVSERESVLAGPVATDDAEPVIQQLQDVLQKATDGLPVQHFHQARLLFSKANEQFADGRLGLDARAAAESLFLEIAATVRKGLNPGSRDHRELLNELNVLLADRVFCNFSLFQSLPDAWGISQVFPIAPLQRLHEAPARPGLLHDLTCDSDGTIKQYVDHDGVEDTLPIHEQRDDETYLLGIFLLGAYQEILGDMHNLFGDTDAVNIYVDEHGYHLGQHEPGDAVDGLLSYVHFDREQMLARYRACLRESAVDDQDSQRYYAELAGGLLGYTYLGD